LKLKTAASPIVPATEAPMRAPCVCAQSSTTQDPGTARRIEQWQEVTEYAEQVRHYDRFMPRP
jgi:hypothetical protein